MTIDLVSMAGHSDLTMKGLDRLSLRVRRSLIGILMVLPGVIVIAVFIIYPVFEALRVSLYEFDFLTDQKHFVGLANYAAVIRDPKFTGVLTNTLVWSAGSLVGQFALGFVAALLINRDHPGMGLVRSILLVPYVVPVITVALVCRWMLDGSYGILSHALQLAGFLGHDQSPLADPGGAMIVVIVANIWRSFPFVMIAYWAAMQGIPKEQYEAARIDGANVWQELRYVTLPNLWGVTVTLLMLRLFWTVTYFDLVWLITQGGPGSATELWPIWIRQEAMGFFHFGYAAAIAVSLSAALITGWALYASWVRLAGSK
jgi:multiple sugar transport system permease protein